MLKKKRLTPFRKSTMLALVVLCGILFAPAKSEETCSPDDTDCKKYVSTTPCDVGFFKEAGTDYCFPCPAGKDCGEDARNGLVLTKNLEKCPEGFYCEDGKDKKECDGEMNCPKGSYMPMCKGICDSQALSERYKCQTEFPSFKYNDVFSFRLDKCVHIRRGECFIEDSETTVALKELSDDDMCEGGFVKKCPDNSCCNQGKEKKCLDGYYCHLGTTQACEKGFGCKSCKKRACDDLLEGEECDGKGYIVAEKVGETEGEAVTAQEKGGETEIGIAEALMNILSFVKMAYWGYVIGNFVSMFLKKK